MLLSLLRVWKSWLWLVFYFYIQCYIKLLTSSVKNVSSPVSGNSPLLERQVQKSHQRQFGRGHFCNHGLCGWRQKPGASLKNSIQLWELQEVAFVLWLFLSLVEDARLFRHCSSPEEHMCLHHLCPIEIKRMVPMLAIWMLYLPQARQVLHHWAYLKPY